MTKTKRNLVLVVSLLFAIFTLCSVFAGVSFHTLQTVEAGTLTDTELQYRRDNPGLYETGTTTLVKSWAKLIDDGDITTTNNELEVVNKKLVGDLICGSVGTNCSIDFAFANCLYLTGVEVEGIGSLIGAFYNCKSLKYCRMNWISYDRAVGTFAGVRVKTLDLSESVEWCEDAVYRNGSSIAAIGSLGLNDEWCMACLGDYSTKLFETYQKAMDNLNILENLENCYTSDSEKWIIDLYKEKAEGKTGSELGKCGKTACVVSMVKEYGDGSMTNEGEWNFTEAMFETDIKTIYLPMWAPYDGIGQSVSLPKGNYVYELNGEKKEITTCYLQGYKELGIDDENLTELAIFVDTLDAPNSKIGRIEESVPATGVKLDSTTIIVAIAVVGVGVVVVSAMVIRKIIHDKKHKNRKF